MIIIRDPDRKQAIASQAMIGPGNVYRSTDCSALVVFLSDQHATKRVARIQQLERDANSNSSNNAYLATLPIRAHFLLGQGMLATSVKQAALGFVSRTSRPMPTVDPIAVWSAKHTGMVVQSFVLAATSHGLATTIMEGFDERRLGNLLRVPMDRYRIPMVVATGYDYFENDDSGEETVGSPTSSPRLLLDELVFAEEFGTPGLCFSDDSLDPKIGTG